MTTEKREEINFTIYSNAVRSSNNNRTTALSQTMGFESKSDDSKEEQRLTITSIGETGIQSKEPKKNHRLIIPLPEEDRLHTAAIVATTGDTPPTAVDIALASAPPTSSEESNLKYGLNKKTSSTTTTARTGTERTKQQKHVPILMKNRVKGLENLTTEDEKFRYDVANRPDSASEDAYQEMPVDSFGAALLRGMGWEEGKPIGLNSRGLITPIEFVARGHRQGLGADRKPEEIRKRKRPLKQGETNEPPPQMVVPKDANGRQRHYRTLDEKLVPHRPNGINVGSLVGIISGIHDGMYARVISFLQDGQLVRVRFLSEEEVVVSKDDITEMSKIAKDHPAQRISSSSSTSAPPSSSSIGSSKSAKKAKYATDEKLWITPHIVVRIISKSLGGGKYYNKRVRVMDVLGRKNVQVMLENGQILEDVRQNQLETALPKVGGSVLIIGGDNHLRGKQGTLLERDNEKQKAQVRLIDENVVETLHFDDISEYDPHES